MNFNIYPIIAISVVSIVECSQNKRESWIQASPFPYGNYLELSEEDQLSPKIGDNGNGLDAISNHIRYSELLSANRLLSSRISKPDYREWRFA